jgi:archaemetzincin
MRILLLLLSLLLFSCSEKIDSETTVDIQPYNGFSESKAKAVAQIISGFYHVKTIILKDKKIDKSTFINVKSPRYRADKIIRLQKEELTNSDYIIGLTDKDISTTKYDNFRKVKQPAYKYEDWGVMGLGYCPGKSCVVSTFRIKHKKEKITLTRLQKVAVHEFGHNLGLPHCPNKDCVMTDAVESIATVDNAALDLCSKCKSKIN